MKKTILSLLLICGLSVGFAQATSEGRISEASAGDAPAAASSTERSDWLASFDAVSVDGDLDIRFVRVPESEAPHIVYDTKGSYTTKFRVDVHDRELRIREQSDSRRPERTTVTLYYNSLRALSVAQAVASFDDVLIADLFDLTVDSRASLVLGMDVRDLYMHLAGESRVTLTGCAHYLTLAASTGRVDALDLYCVAARINAQSRARVRLNVSERLEAKTSTGASIRYKQTPELLRVAQNFLAGSVGLLDDEEGDEHR